MREKLKLDAADIRILAAVQKYGQLSKARLAELVNLSPTPCYARLGRLREAGFIQGYRADIALEKIADVTTVIVTVSLTHHRKTDFDRFEAYIQTLDEIIDCHATGGGMDYVMTVVTQSLASFQEVMENLLNADLSIDRYITYIVTRRIKKSVPNLSRLTGGAAR